jgi:hypothetical protein
MPKEKIKRYFLANELIKDFLQPPPPAPLKPKPKTKQFVASFKYVASNEDELSFEIGDMITFTEDIEEGWAKGETENGDSGLYPTNFVKVIISCFHTLDIFFKFQDLSQNNRLEALVSLAYRQDNLEINLLMKI